VTSFLAGLTLGSILLGAALVIVVVLFLARPFAARQDEAARAGREEIDALLLRKESLLRDIRELDEDYDSAKVAPELYRHTRPQLVKEAALVMKQLDERGYVETGVAPAGVDAQIEAAVRRLRTPEQVDEEIEAAVRGARAKSSVADSDGSISLCPQCGHRVEADDRFCSNCGHHLAHPSKPAQAARA
jgi:hypothetical protein